MNTKYIFVTGGVVSGLGKGITAASLGRLLKITDFLFSKHGVIFANPKSPLVKWVYPVFTVFHSTDS